MEREREKEREGEGEGEERELITHQASVTSSATYSILQYTPL